MIAHTPDPPYTAVIFTSVHGDDVAGYDELAADMDALAAAQPGFLGMESARSNVGITVSYWVDEAAAAAWKQVTEHLAAQRLGRERFYARYQVRVATVRRSYGHP